MFVAIPCCSNCCCCCAISHALLLLGLMLLLLYCCYLILFFSVVTLANCCKQFFAYASASVACGSPVIHCCAILVLLNAVVHQFFLMCFWIQL
jgi:hypothetical protein